MAPKRRREDDEDDSEELGKITWISDNLYNDLNLKRQLGREHLNRRLEAHGLEFRPAQSIPRPRGEAGRRAGHRNGFTLRDILKHKSNVNPEHYAMIQDTVHRLAARYLDVRRTWRENQGDDLVTVCTEAAKLHPCLYDYDAFWPVHDHLKRHLLSTRNKYSYLDPDLVDLYDAEAVARGEARPPPRKKRQILSKNQHSAKPPRSLSPQSSAPYDESLVIDVDRSPEPEVYLLQLLRAQSSPTSGESSQRASPQPRPLELGRPDGQSRQLQSDSGSDRTLAEDRASATEQHHGTEQRPLAPPTIPRPSASLSTTYTHPAIACPRPLVHDPWI